MGNILYELELDIFLWDITTYYTKWTTRFGSMSLFLQLLTEMIQNLNKIHLQAPVKSRTSHNSSHFGLAEGRTATPYKI
jgi:hypothetical protein